MPNYNKESAKKQLQELIDLYNSNHDYYISNRYNESQCRLEFIDKFFECLGWDVQNNQGKKPQLKEVTVESYEQELGKPDYTFNLNGRSVFFVEAKKPHVDIKTDKDPCFQAKRYGWSAKHKIVILTNFENLIIYDTSVMPKPDDEINNNLVGIYNYKEYYDKFDEIYSMISKEIIYNGTYETLFNSNDSIRLNVDEFFLKQINDWRLELGNFLYKKEKNIKNINFEIQTIINQIVFLRICEDRNLPLYKTLAKSTSKDETLQSELLKLLTISDRTYNSGIFKNKELLQLFDKSIIKNIITSLYYPISPYDFTVISSDILGEIYELFLSETLVEDNGVLRLKAKKENLNRSIVTTPFEIVKYMTEKSMEKIIVGKSPNEIKKMKFADIACGSGIFLTNMLEYIINYCENWYEDNKEFSKLEKTNNNSYKLPYIEKRELLSSCIYGNDIDIQAVEVSKFSLLLKVLENESINTVIDINPILPSLDMNVEFGNSLIDFNMAPSTDDYIELNPFSWNLVSPGLKFDLIIGNPPYVKTSDMKNLLTEKEMNIYKEKYKTAYKQFDKYFLFIERAISLLKDNGKLCYIVPNKFMKVASGKELRNLIANNNYLELLIDFNYQQVFINQTIYTCIIMLNKEGNNQFEYNYITDYNNWKLNNLSEQNIIFNSNEIDDKIWILSNDLKKMNDLKKLFSNSLLLSEIATPFNGVQTSLNNIYVIKGNEIIDDNEKYLEFIKNDKKYKVEKNLLKRYYQPITMQEKNVKTYDPLYTDKYIIFPYNENGELINIDDFPKFKNYVETFYNIIAPRQVTGNSQGRDVPNSNTSNWYQYGRTQALTEFNNQDKLIVGVMSKEPMFMFDNNNLVIQSGGTAGYCGIKLKEDSPYSLEFLQAYLSHPIMTSVMECLGSDFEGGFYSRGTVVLNILPIIKINFDDEKEKELYYSINSKVKSINEINDKIMNNEDIQSLEIINRMKSNLIKEINDDIYTLIEMKG